MGVCWGRIAVGVLGVVAFTGACSLVTDLDGLSVGAQDAGGNEHVGDAMPEGGVDANLGAYAREVLADQPVAYYRLDEKAGSLTVRDTSGSAPTSQSVGGAVTLGEAGLVKSWTGAAAAFDGTRPADGTIKFAANPRLEPPTALTIELWYRMGPVAPAAGKQFSLVNHGTDTQGLQETYLIFIGAGGEATFFLGQPGQGPSKRAVASTPLAVSSTHFLAATYDGATMFLYVDGLVAATVPATGKIVGYDGVHGLSIGAEYTGQYPTTGLIDEVAIYDSALPLGRIRAHYLAAQ